MGRSATLPVLLIIAFLPSIQLLPQPVAGQPTTFIQKTWGSGGGDRGHDIALDSAGNIYVTGYTDNFGAGDPDVFLLKYDSSGSLQWQRTWGGSRFDAGFGVAVDSFGGIYVTGNTGSFVDNYFDVDVFLLKFDSSGNLQWQRTWGGGSADYGEDVVVDSSDNIYVTGYTYSVGPEAVVLLKFDSSGSLQWQRTWNESAGSRGHSVVAGLAGSIYVAGPLCSTYCYKDILLLKFDSSGNLQFQNAWSRTGNYFPYGASVDSSGNIYIAGYTNSLYTGGDDVVLLKTNSSGTLQWQRTWGGSAEDQAWAVIVDSSGNIYVTGSTRSFEQGSALFLKFDSSGSLKWQSAWGGGGGEGVAVDSSGNIYATGAVSLPLPQPFTAVNGTLSTPSIEQRSVSGTLIVPTFNTQTPSANADTPSGSESFAGPVDAFLLKLGPVSISPPSAPRYVNAMTPTNQSTVVLSWSAPEFDGGSVITGYRIYRGTADGEEILLATVGVTPPAGVSNQYADNSVTGTVAYYYRITATNAAGEGRFIKTSATPFGVWYVITVGIDPSGSGRVRCDGPVYSLEFDRAQSQGQHFMEGHYTCYATPKPGHRFSGWSGLASGDSNPISFQATRTGTLTATFVPNPTLIFGLPMLQFYGLLGGLVGIIVALVILVQMRRRRQTTR